MKLTELLLPLKRKAVYIPEKFDNLDITSICHDSRKATDRCIFVCCVGSTSDGHTFAMNAYLDGARVFIVERDIDIPSDAVIVKVDSTKEALSELSLRFYGYPAESMQIIGITGTKGKTTLALSLHSIMNRYGKRAGYIGTNGVIFDQKRYETQNTTPDVLEIQKYLRMMADAKIEICIIEVSSQALWQDRIYGLKFDTCIFTNLYKDHIGGAEHPDMDHYKSCKKRLFTAYSPKCAVTNLDSDESSYMLDGCNASRIITTSANGNKDSDIYAENIRRAVRGGIPGVFFDLHFSIKDMGKDKRDVFLPFPGVFNVENALEIIGACACVGIDTSYAINSLSSLSIPGRSEFIRLENKKNTLFVIDYAHNGASLAFALSALREYTKGRLIVVFGSVGGRTMSRRRELGEAAKNFADISIITSDNPNFEDPMSVIADIAKEFDGSGKELYKIAEREDAIRLAYDISDSGDTVLLAGKGHEDYQLVRGKKLPFSEKDILFGLDMQNEYCKV